MALQRDPQPIFDDGDVQLFAERDLTIGYTGLVPVPHPGGPTDNREQIEAKLDQAIATFAQNFQNWGTLTNAQKDAANRQAQRGVAILCRIVRQAFDQPGP